MYTWRCVLRVHEATGRRLTVFEVFVLVSGEVQYWPGTVPYLRCMKIV
jgi:hypothetical protein